MHGVPVAVFLLGGISCRAQTKLAEADVGTVEVSTGALVIVPGRQLGAIEIGMSRDRLLALRVGVPAPLPRSTSDGTTERFGMYTVNFGDDAKVRSISVALGPLKDVVEVRRESVSQKIPSSASIAEIATLFPTCGKLVVNIGATYLKCDGGGFMAIHGGPTREPNITLSVAAAQ